MHGTTIATSLMWVCSAPLVLKCKLLIQLSWRVQVNPKILSPPYEPHICKILFFGSILGDVGLLFYVFLGSEHAFFR